MSSRLQLSDPSASTVDVVFRQAERFMFELVSVGVPAAAVVLLAPRLGGDWLHAGVVVAAGVVVLAVSPARRWWLAGWRRARLGRKAGGVSGRLGAPVAFGRWRRVTVGWEADVQVAGWHAHHRLGPDANHLAGVFGVRDVRVREHASGDASRATVTLVQHDLLDGFRDPWPSVHANRLSLWDPVALGVSELGDPVRVQVVGGHALLAGETGSGKTAMQSMVLATAALDPTARLFVLDANEMLWAWEPLADRYVVDDMAAAQEILEDVLGEHKRRNTVRKRAGLDKWSRGLADETGDGPVVVAVDEAPEFLAHRGCRDLLRRVAATTRVTAVHASITIQSPNASVIDTTLRNNFGLRAVFRVADQTASRVALGSGAVDASSIDRRHRGVCFLHRDEHWPVRMRTHYLAPDELRGLAGRAARLRGAAA